MKMLSEHYREKFGCKVYKLSLDGGFTCPNRDGTCGTRGCIFCAGDGSGAFAEGTCGNLLQQMEQAKRRVESKNKEGKYIAYFQSFTNTYAPMEYLRRLYTEAVAPEYIVGLSVGTRPDCLEDDVICLLAEINAVKPVSVELGLQTVHEETARYIRRGYDTAVYYDAVRRLKAAGLEVVTHIILGLPGETVQMMMETTRKAVLAGTDGIKFHMLHVLRETDLAREYEAGKVPVFTLEEYGEVLKECISCLPEHIVVHRITGDGAKKDLIAPLWSADKKRVLNYLHKVLEI
ncbi:MAG: TIGR01212 family radical SAM protein [Oscillospiraceae bacterium]|nr:TIGR01212 family radical SAM protein [Oscillospiraceae bacterium]